MDLTVKRLKFNHSAISPRTVGDRVDLTRGGWNIGGYVLLGMIGLTTSCSDKKQSQPPATTPVVDILKGVVATKEKPYENSLKMKFVQVPISAEPSGVKRLLFSIWETRVRDFEAFIHGSSEYRYEDGTMPFSWGNQEWEQKTGVTWQSPGFNQTADHPVTCVSWWDAVAFCKWLTTTERAARRIGEKDEYRLPSDMEWSFAVGIGEREDFAKSPEEKDGKIPDIFPWGLEWPPPKGAGNYGSSSSGSLGTDNYDRTAPVASFPANSLGLYDLGGNVGEWCNDKYTPLQAWRVMRGGSWIRFDRQGVAAAYRNCRSPGYRSTNHGFRCVLAVDGS